MEYTNSRLDLIISLIQYENLLKQYVFDLRYN